MKLGDRPYCEFLEADVNRPVVIMIQPTGVSNLSSQIAIPAFPGPRPSTVATISAGVASEYSIQRKVFYASGRWWAFWAVALPDGYMKYATSTDGSSWSSPTDIVAVNDGGKDFSVIFDGTYFHYARTPVSGSGWPIYYQRGLPNSNGTITWSAAEQTAFDEDSAYAHHEAPNISVDADGYVWITTCHTGVWNPVKGQYARGVWVTKNNNADGTWSTAPGFPYDVTANAAGMAANVVVPLTGGKAYVIWAEGGTDNNYGGKMWGRLYTGSWDATETIEGSLWSYIKRASAAAIGDDVHLIYAHEEGNTAFKLRYQKRTYGVGWGNITTLYAQWPPSCALIARGSDLYAFYNKATATVGQNPANVSSPTVAYRKWNGSAWEDEVIVATEANDLVIKSMTSSPKRGVEWQLKTSNYLRYLG